MTTEENGADLVTSTGAIFLWFQKPWYRMIANMEAYETGKTISKVAREKTDLSEEELDRQPDVRKQSLLLRSLYRSPLPNNYQIAGH